MELGQRGLFDPAFIFGQFDAAGDRSQLYHLFGETQLDMSVTELLASYGVIDGVAEYDSVSRWDNDYYNAENG